MQQQQPMNGIRFDDVSYARDGKAILADVSLSVSARRVGVVGRNGSGKTTLSRLVAGLLDPDTGEIRVAGISPSKNRKAALSAVGILFQNPDHQIIFPTVLEELCFGLTQMGETREAAEKQALTWLADYQVTHWRDAHVSQLSQGQKQLLCLMSVLAMRPKWLILDEPFSGLDLPIRAQLTRRLARYDGHLLHVTHAPEDLTGYDDVIWLDQGRLVGQGAPDTLLPAYLDEMARQGESDDLADLAN
ncbi:energy-coupling factor ABC transporter ATP-binding protein (plasmid) [Aliiroseovarius crassostreae]|uniref:Energy-coupling factor ABC transporter ATP-binding protein n=1 Tax=Aliiroseovarius crassostreae TaxID=154981 RepID=A0A9Q9HBM9_9RHOB|nr:energy-coupling factor ABC transporter ATP-binding protein [Aliiroseovarius crassostreae]UWP93970.1 energy-coupling factor ABC transporter ATP-binding protein [Aliiroseovarius crassostreae]UWP97118.1 energy-coupling factor ABC transporter ATP-binding protein [Aliiroseovarius crassostreae]